MEIKDIHKICYENNLDSDQCNISLWDPDKEYIDYMNQFLKLDFHNIEYKYLYPQYFGCEIVDKIFHKLKIKNIEPNCAIGLTATSSGMLAIENVIRHIKEKYHINKLIIINPSYFAFPYVCRKFNIEYDFISIEQTDGFYFQKSDLENILKNRDQMVIFSSPIFNQGIQFSNKLTNQIQKIINNKIFCIFDECATSNGFELCKRLRLSLYTFFIYETHKVFGINDLKAAILIGESENVFDIDDFITLSQSPLSYSSKLSIMHYLTENYNLCLSKLYEFLNCRISNLKSKFGDKISYGGVGVYAMVNTNINCDNIPLYDLMSTIISSTKCAFIPSSMHTYKMEKCLSFRVNLLMNYDKICKSIEKILDFKCDPYTTLKT